MNYQEEYIKCFKDKSRKYFIENYLSTFDASQRKEVPFKLFPRQVAFVNSLASNDNTIAIKPRQSGITTVSSGWITGQIVFASKKSPETVLCIGNKLDISEQLVEKIGNFLDQVPRWMWGSEFYSPDPNDPKNIKSIYKKRNKNHIELFNGCRVYARSSGEHAARGISAVSILIFDEAAFIQNSLAVYAQALAATSSVEHSRVIVVSTPNGKDPLYYKLYDAALKKQNNFTPVIFKWYQDRRYNRHLEWYRIDKDTNEVEWNRDTVIDKKGNVEYNEQRWAKLEKDGWKPTSPWYKDMCKSFNNDTQKIAQELDVSFLGSADNVVPVDVIEAQNLQNVVVLPEDWPLKDVLINDTWIWKDPVPGHRYICSVDSSSGASEDRTAIEIIDIDAVDEETGKPYVEQVLEYYGRMTGDEIGEMVFTYASIYNNALVVCDAIGGYSDAAILKLMSLKYDNLYYDDPGLKTYTVQQDYVKFGRRKDGKLPGFRTNNVRLQMLSNFVAHLKSNGFRVRSTRVISELETWVWKNGRPDHMEGAHDDAIYCLAMALFVMEFSMLKTEKQKAKDVYMLKSWQVNNTNNSQQFVKEVKNNINMTPNMKINPFINETHSRQKAHIKGCLMLGGFAFKKRN